MKSKLSAFAGFLIVVIYGCQSYPIDVFLIGDSTMADKREEVRPETGWGQALPDFFTAKVAVHNHARNGRSSKSFIDQGRWDKVLGELGSGDYVFIQFAHNDQKDYDTSRYTAPDGQFKANLARFINESLSLGATPVVFTPVVRRVFDSTGFLHDTHGPYSEAIRQVAREMEVDLIDLNVLTERHVNALGIEESKQFFLWLDPEEHPNYPEGVSDNTHLSTYGAYATARMVADELRRLKIPLHKYLKNPENYGPEK